MYLLVRLFLLLLNYLVMILIKLGFGWLIVYYGVMVIFLSDWMSNSELNDTISTVGFFVVLGFCIVRKICVIVKASRYA